mgnify:CR=1 FL=1|tara:strand:+ start:2708 stop:3079 length:372 start_codon:yes stop_codon:yes gene_type:complete
MSDIKHEILLDEIISKLDDISMATAMTEGNTSQLQELLQKLKMYDIELTNIGDDISQIEENTSGTKEIIELLREQEVLLRKQHQKYEPEELRRNDEEIKRNPNAKIEILLYLIAFLLFLILIT